MITESPVYYYGQGELWLGTAVAGNMPAAFDTSICQIDKLEIALASTFIEHTSKRTSIAKKDLKVLQMISATGKITCSQHSALLLKKYLYGTKAAVAGGSVSATAFRQTTAAVGDYLPLPSNKTKVSSLVVTDSAGSPATLVLGTDYEADVDAGIVKILSLGSYTQPFKAAFTEAAGTSVDIFQTTPPLQGLHFKGISLTENAAIKTVQIPKLMISPASSWGLLNDGTSPNSYEIDFEILEDTSNTYPFGRYRE